MKYSILAAGIATALTFPLSAQQQKTTTNNEEAVEVITVKSSRGLISYVSASGAKSDTPIIETPLSFITVRTSLKSTLI